MAHSYYDSMGFEESHDGRFEECPSKKCRRELKYYREIPSADPWPDNSPWPYGNDPWMKEGI